MGTKEIIGFKTEEKNFDSIFGYNNGFGTDDGLRQ